MEWPAGYCHYGFQARGVTEPGGALLFGTRYLILLAVSLALHCSAPACRYMLLNTCCAASHAARC